jgi:hypothetical protein
VNVDRLSRVSLLSALRPRRRCRQLLGRRNARVWRTDATFYRLETDLPERDAVAQAETLP